MVKPIDRERLSAILRQFCDGTGQILLVEDDEDTRAVLRQALTGEGWKVIEADNGRAALEKLAEWPIGAIVLDLMMPEMDGFEFVATLRRHPEWHAIPVLVVTALDLSAADRQRLNGAVERVIQKSGHSGSDLFREIGQAVAACVRRQRGAAGPAPTAS
jgi:CheY-like chemotaxis protein